MTLHGRIPFLLGSFLFMGLCSIAADWNEWRGPGRDGHVSDSPPLMDQWPTQGLAKVWQSEEKFPSDKAGGFGSVAVAAGKVYCIYAPQRVEKIETRTLSEAKLRSFGWTDKKLPAELQAPMEAARISPERQALKDRKEIQTWVKSWTETNLTAELRKTWGSFVADRLNKGDAAMALDVLEKLGAIKNREFPTAAELDKWLDEQSIQGEDRKKILAAIPVSRRVRDNMAICLDAADGKTVWKKTLDGGEGENGPGCTPCVVDGKVYGFGEGRIVFCLDAATGDVVWSAETAQAAEKQCSFIVQDSVAIAPLNPLTGFDAANGKVLWTNSIIGNSWSSPVRWKNEDRTFVIARGSGKVACVDPRTGAMLWSMPDNGRDQSGGSTPAIDGNRMVLAGGNVGTYRLSREKAELIGSATVPMDYCSGPTIQDGHAYIWGRKGGSCISLDTGNVVWTNGTLTACAYSAAILADGKMFIGGAQANSGYGDGSLTMFQVSPEKGVMLGKAPIKQILCTYPAIADGRAYCRMNNGIACFDLRK